MLWYNGDIKNKKGKPMKKELITLTAIAATGIIGTAHADTVELPLPTTAKTEPALVEKEAPKPVEVKTPTKEEVAELGATAKQTQEDADKAKEVLDRANETSDKAEKKVESLKQAKDDAQKVADKATPEAIQNAEKKVETAKAKVQVKEEALNSAQSLKAESDEVVSNQEKIVEGKKEEIEKLQSAVLEAKNNVQLKQNILDGTKISEEKKSAEEALEQETANVKRLSDELAKAEIEDEKHSQKIKNAENDLAEAITKVSTSNQSISSASEKVKQTQSELIKAQENLANQNPKNTIKLTDSFVEVWKELADKHYPYNYETQKELFEKYKAEQSEKLKKIASESEALNQYKSNEQDKDRAIDFEKTTREQREELSLFANDLYNQVRKQIGASEAVVTKGMIDLSEGFSDFGKYSDFVINSQSFAFYTVSNKTKTISNMDEAKRHIYEGFKRFLFDYNYYTPYYDSSTQSQGVASNYVLGEKNKKLYFALWPYLYSGEIGFAWSTLRADLVEGIPNFDKTVIKPSNSTQSNTVSNESASTAVKTAEDNYTKAKVDLEKAESEYKEHLSIQKDIHNRLELLKSTPFKASLVKAELAKAQKLQIEAQKRLALAQKAQDEVMTDIKFKQENLDKAKQELVDKENALKLGKDKLQQEEAELTKLQADVSAKAQAVSTAKKALQDAQEEVKLAEKELADLNGAHTRLKEAKAELEKAETELKDAYQAQNKAKLDYEVKSLAAGQAQTTYKTAKAKYEEAETKRLAALAEEKRKELEKAGYQPVPVVDAKGNVVDYTVEKVTVGTKADKTYQAPAQAINEKSEPKKQLPNTGTKESSLLAFLGASIGLLALAGKRKYR